MLAGEFRGVLFVHLDGVPGDHIDAPAEVRDTPRRGDECLFVLGELGRLRDWVEVVNGVARRASRANVLLDPELRHARFRVPAC